MNIIRLETEVIIEPLLKEVKSIEKKLNKKTKVQIYNIQEEILILIIDAEYRINGLKSTIDAINNFIKQCRHLDKELKAVPFQIYQNISTNLYNDIEEYKDRINILKSFMDTILWKFLSNIQLKYLSLNEKESPIIEKVGLLDELHKLKLLNQKFSRKKIIFILSDLTNTAKTSDILAIGEKGLKCLIECKTSVNTSKRLERQESRANGLADFFNKGESKGKATQYINLVCKSLKFSSKNSEWTTKIKPFKFKYEYSAMNKCIKKAKLKGTATLKINDCITFICFDLTKINTDALTDEQIEFLDKFSRRQMTPDLLDKVEKKIPFSRTEYVINPNFKFQGKPFIFDVRQYGNYMGYRSYHYLPFASFNISQDYILDLLLDKILFLVIVDLDNLSKRLMETGLKAKFSGNEAPQYLVVENSKEKQMIVGDLFFKLGHEVMCVDSFIALVNKTFNEVVLSENK